MKTETLQVPGASLYYEVRGSGPVLLIPACLGFVALGYVGLLCLLGYLWSFLRQAIALLKFDQSQAVLYLALLFHQLITNLTETTWLSSSSFDFVVMTFATFAMARAMVEQWLQSHYGEARLQVTPRPLERVRAAPARFR